MMRDHNKSTTCTTIMKVRRHFLCIVRKYEGIMKVLSYFRTFIVALHVGPHVKVYTKVRRYNTGTTL